MGRDFKWQEVVNSGRKATLDSEVLLDVRHFYRFIYLDECFLYSLNVKVRKSSFKQRTKSRTFEHF